MKTNQFLSVLFAAITLVTFSSCKVVQSIADVAGGLLDVPVASSQTGNQNYQVGVSQCYVIGSDVYVEFSISNLMSEDGTDIWIRNASNDSKYIAFDNMGNQYSYTFVSDNVKGYPYDKIVGGVPAGMTIKILAKIPNVKQSATSVANIRFKLRDYNGGRDRINQDLIFRNIPISR